MILVGAVLMSLRPHQIGTHDRLTAATEALADPNRHQQFARSGRKVPNNRDGTCCAAPCHSRLARSARPCALVAAGVAAAGRPARRRRRRQLRSARQIVVGCALSGAPRPSPRRARRRRTAPIPVGKAVQVPSGQHDADTVRQSLADRAGRDVDPRTAASWRGLPAASRSAADILEVGWPEPALCLPLSV